ncbi:carbohydrate-binding protein [Spongiactinospora sp. TRM90649]|uniref:dioxygenase family protein n=1 Tax=Spongiactinospora sp. TRM90649 TaxID=3031114 RepID=UPI0023F7320A|nr:carbohydrate-binding protein [Spongiactinospora sp. TRM90649]MDF5754134.1 dioxygenase [Spongiactinospora sp. TRM90649]
MDAEHTGDEREMETGKDGKVISRKTLLRAAVMAAPISLLVPQIPALARNMAPGQPLEPTPYCSDGDPPTLAQTEGPYFKPNSPQRSTLPGSGTALVVTGYVFNRACQPVANALLDFWQADNNGNYDNYGFTFRGHQFTNAQGQYRLVTIVPGLYPGRTRHIHVKVQAPGRPILTTQLYFPGEPRNSTDTIYNPRLLMTMSTSGGQRQGTYDFVLNIAGQPTSSPTNTPTNSPTGGPTGGPTTWAAGTAYSAGATVTYNGTSYRCLQSHTALPGWEPPNVPALWARA